ncbi:MAG: dockerin type I domain-containing protein [Aristaeellaceae bacterium]
MDRVSGKVKWNKRVVLPKWLNTPVNTMKWIVLAFVVVMVCLCNNALAYSGSDYTTNSSLATKLDNLINGKVAIFSNTSTKFPVGSSLNNSTTYYWKNGYYSGKQCYAYGQAAYYYLFGDVPYHGSGSYSNSKVVSGVKGLNTLSYDVLVKGGVGCGAYIRTTDQSSGSYNGNVGHSMIVLTYNSNGITILHGNSNGKGAITINTYTWASFNSTHISGKGRYVSHIVQPNLTANSISGYTRIDSLPRIAKSIKVSTSTDPCEVRKAPNKDGEFVRSVDKDTIIYLKGAVKNTAGNTWYETEDGYFIYSGDLEILVDDASYTETKYGALGISKTSDCWLKDRPYEASDHHERVVAQGKTVSIVAKVVNSYGNTWYKTSDGYFVYSSDVTLYEMEQMFTISATFKNTEKRDSHKAPYLDSPDVKSYANGATVTVTRFVKNSYGNIWAQLSDGSFLCFYDKETGDNKLTFIAMTSAFTTSGVVKPTGNIPLNTAFGLRGKITATAPMLTVTARVIDKSTNKAVVGPVSASPSATTRTVDLNASVNGVNINNKMPFSKLTTAGYYRYEVIVQLGFTYNSKTFKFGAEQVVISSDFTAGNPAKVLVEKITVLNQISKLAYGEPYDFRWEVYPSNATDKTVTWSSSNTDVIWIPEASGTPGVDENAYADVFYRGYGTTTITVRANDGSGVSVSFDVTVYDPNPKPSLENVSLSAGQNLTAMRGGTVTMPIYLSNPNEDVAIGTILVKYELPDGVTISGVETAGIAVGSDKTHYANTLLNNLSGISGSGQILNVTLQLSNSVAFPVTVRMTATVNPLNTGEDVTLSPFTATIEEKSRRVPGDVNDDGQVSTADFLRLAKYLAGWSGITINEANSDVNGDGQVSTADFLRMSKYLSGWDVELK